MVPPVDVSLKIEPLSHCVCCTISFLHTGPDDISSSLSERHTSYTIAYKNRYHDQVVYIYNGTIGSEFR